METKVEHARRLLREQKFNEVVRLLADVPAAEINPKALGLERELALIKQAALDALSGSTVHPFRYPDEDFPD
mgnify:CR=1 FL=1